MFLQVAAAAECSYLFTTLFYRLYSTDAIFFHVSIATSTCYRYNCSAQCLCEKHTSQRRSPNASHKTRLLLNTASLYTCIYNETQAINKVDIQSKTDHPPTRYIKTCFFCFTSLGPPGRASPLNLYVHHIIYITQRLRRLTCFSLRVLAIHRCVFCSCDLDLDPMILIYDLDLMMLMYLYTNNELS